jgi:hypothetical protein
MVDETLRWAEGEWLVVDDSFEHEVWNNCSSGAAGADDATRLVLALDMPHPDLVREPEPEPARVAPRAPAPPVDWRSGDWRSEPGALRRLVLERDGKEEL